MKTVTVDITKIAEKLLNNGVCRNEPDTNFLVDLLEDMAGLERKIYDEIERLKNVK